MKKPRVLRLNNSCTNSATLDTVVSSLKQNYDDRWEATKNDTDNCWSLACPDSPLTFTLTLSDDGNTGTITDSYCNDICSREGTPDSLCDWIGSRLVLIGKIESVFTDLNSSRRSLNSDLSNESANRIKDVFRAAQQAVEFPKGFRYTAFRQNRSEDCILSTLEFTSTKLGAKQWVVKSALSAEFTDEVELGSKTNTVAVNDEWSFQPEYDPERSSNERSNLKNASWNKLYTFTPRTDTRLDPDKQATYWLVNILQDMVDDILDNPPNRVYEFFLAEGLLRKKNLANMADMGLIRLASKGIITGLEILKAKPGLWKKLLEKGFITGEQAYKAQPNQLLWLTMHDYIPVERAIKIDPNLSTKLKRMGKLLEDASESNIDSTQIDVLVDAVSEGKLTPQKAWSLNSKVLKPLIEANLITPQDAYKLEPSILNWMLENHHIGRAEAKRLKPRIEEEMKKKGVDWETLEASTNASRKLNADYDYSDEDGEDAFYVAIDDDLVIKVEKHDGRWYESVEWEGEDAREFRTATYMGYLTHDDIKTWIRRDFPNAYIRELSEDEYYDFIEEQEYDDDYDDDDWEDLDSSRHLNASTYEELITRFKAGDYIDDDVSLHTNAKVPMRRGAEPVDTVYLRKEPGEQGKILGFAHNKAGDYSYDLLEAADITNVDLSPYMNGFDITDFEGLLDCLKAAGILEDVSEEDLDASVADEVDDSFYISVEYGSLIILVEQYQGRWVESEIYQSDDFESKYGRFRPTSYMGYLSKRDIMNWIRQDYPGCQVNQISANEVEDFLDGSWEDE